MMPNHEWRLDMPDRTYQGQRTPRLVNPQEKAAEPFVLMHTERILGSSDAKAVSRQLDIASIFYASGATIIGIFSGAFLYLWNSSPNPLKHPVEWLFWLFVAMLVGGLVALPRWQSF
jgi:hypothetical protein